MSSSLEQRLDEIVEFDFTKEHSPRIREVLTVRLCEQFLEPLSKIIEKSEMSESEPEKEAVTDDMHLMKKMDEYLKSDHMNHIFSQRNVKCNAVLPFISAAHVPDWEQRDLAVVASFGFPNKVPASLRARYRSNKLLEIMEGRLTEMFRGHEVTDIEQNKSAKVPYLLCQVDDVTMIIKISIKPFCSPQFLSGDLIEEYRKYDDRFILLAVFFHKFLLSKVVTKRDQRKAKSVIPKLCSLQMMFIHFFKHYGLLPNDIEEMMSRMSVSSKKRHSLAVLFFLFLDYYLNIISLEKEFLEIHTGEVVEKISIGLTNKNILSISDIFDDHIPGERVNDTLIFKRILSAAFVNIKKYLKDRTGDVLNDLRVIPLRPPRE